MEIKYSDKRIELKKELNSLDKFVLDFTSILNNLNIKYVIVSGYVSILFGRSRTSEDIDIIIERLDFDKFGLLWKEIIKYFECLNTRNAKEAYEEYLLDGYSIRFSEKKKFIPNMEIKFPKVELDFWTLQERKEVILNVAKIHISPLELQISFKLFLGSEKDIEDAKHLYGIFKGNLDISLLKGFNRKLKIEDLFSRYIG